MARTSIALCAALSLLLGMCQAAEEAAEESGGVPAAATPDACKGVVAVYCLTWKNSFLDQAGTIFVSYYVTAEQWAARFDAVPGFVQSNFSIPLTGVTMRRDADSFSFHLPWDDSRHLFDLPCRSPRAAYNAQSYSHRMMVCAIDEARLWDLPADFSDRVGLFRNSGQSTTDLQRSQSLAGREFVCSMQTDVNRGVAAALVQTVLPGWQRTHTDFQVMGTGSQARQVSSVTLISSAGDRYQKFNEALAGRYPGDHARPNAGGLAFYRGGRHVRTDWKRRSGVVVPASIRVTIGDSGQGMLVRAARMIKCEVLEAETVRQRIRELSGQAGHDLAAVRLSKIISRYFWMKAAADLNEPLRDYANRLTQHHNLLQKQDRVVGDQIGLANNMVRLACSTDDSPERLDFRRKLSTYLDMLAENAGAEGQLVALFSLIKMARHWDRPDLEEIATDEMSRAVQSHPLDRQVDLLFFAEGPVQTRDVHCRLLLELSHRCLDAGEIPDPTVRAVLIVAMLRFRAECGEGGVLSAADVQTIKDAGYRARLRAELFGQCSRLLQRLRGAKSRDLQQAGERLQSLLETVEAE